MVELPEDQLRPATGTKLGRCVSKEMPTLNVLSISDVNHQILISILHHHKFFCLEGGRVMYVMQLQAIHLQICFKGSSNGAQDQEGCPEQ